MEQNKEQAKAQEKEQKKTNAPEKKTDNPQKKEKQNNVLQPDLRRLKKAWEKVQQHQTAYPRFRKKPRIAAVKIVKNEKGKKAVEVQMSDGGKFNDVGDKRDLFVAMATKKKPSLSQLMSLVDAVRSLGFDAVAMGLPPELKKALLNACKQCGVPLKPKEAKKVLASSSSKSEKKVSDSSAAASKQKQGKERKRRRHNPHRLPLPDYPITSVRSLDQAVEEQKRLNKEYLKNRLKRCENEIKDEYFDQYRNQLTEIEKNLAEGKPLNKNQQIIKRFADMYGLKADKSQEKPTSEQAKARESMAVKDMPEKFQKKLKERTEHYTSICNAKLVALDVVNNDLQNDYYKNRTKINMSQMALAQAAADLLPDPEARNAQTMSKTMEQLNSNLKESAGKLKQTKKEYRSRTENLLFQNGSSEKEAPAPKKTRRLQSDLLRQSYESTESQKTARTLAAAKDARSSR